jgi:hypothetical protein
MTKEFVRMLSNAPGYWQNETSGVLRPAVEAFLTGAKMTPEQIAAMRAYLRQWIMAPAWDRCGGAAVLADLRGGIDALTSRDAIDAWLDHAEEIGIDPL